MNGRKMEKTTKKKGKRRAIKKKKKKEARKLTRSCLANFHKQALKQGLNGVHIATHFINKFLRGHRLALGF